MPALIERPPSPTSNGGHGGRSLFPSTPTFNLDTFARRDFNVKEFVESLSESGAPAYRRSGAGNQAFDPRPLIRTLEHALHRLSELSDELGQREVDLAAQVRRADSQHTSNVNNFGRNLESAIQKCRRLDRSLDESTIEGEAGGSTAVKIGERLEELDRQRLRSQDARFLIQCWLEVSERGELYMLDDMRRQASGDRMIRCAQIARQLLKISQRLDPVNWPRVAVNGVNGAPEPDEVRLKHNTREIIERFRESLEKDLLRQFDDFYRKADFGGMRECADVLRDFNEGASVVGTFVNQHQFFIDRSQLVTEEVGGDAETWEALADPDAESPGIEPSLQSLIDEVKIVVQDESNIIKKAFSYHDVVLARFLQRVFQQSIQQRLEMVLDKAKTISTLAFLRSLQAARSYISALVNDLKAHGLTEHPEPLSSQTSLILDQQFDDLWVPYFVGASYIDREKRNLEELYASLLFKFNLFHSRRRKAPTTYLASLAKSGSELLASARDAYVERLDSTELAPQQKAMLLRVAGLRDVGGAHRPAENDLSVKDGLINTSNTKRMLRWLAEAVGRSLELSGGSETPKDMFALLDLLIRHMGRGYIETALDAANELAAAQENSKAEPDLAHFDQLNPALSTMHLMSLCINTVLIPLAGSNTVVRRDMEKTTNLALTSMEERINALLQRTVDVCISWVTKLLAGQRKTDFRPREDNSDNGAFWQLLQTPTCLAIFTFLSRVHNLALRALASSPNMVAFATELAVNLRGLLLEHFKKFQVSATGGLMVTKDMSKYTELLRSWTLDPTFEPSLEILGVIGNIFVIGPEALRERLRVKPGAVGRLWDRHDLRAYVARRDDVASVGIQAILNGM